MNAHETDPMARFALANQARETVENWAKGAQVLTLLTTLRDKGWIKFLAEPRALDELAEFSGLPPTRLADVLAVLETHSITALVGDKVALAPQYEALTANDAFIGLDELLDRSEMNNRLTRTATEDPAPLPLTDADALVIARSAGGNSTAVTKALYEQQFLPALPELTDAVHAGRWLDVGCGVACATQTLAAIYPDFQATAIELVPAVAEETVRRVAAHGFADRVTVLPIDARTFDEKESFTGAFWAQPFFPESTRADTLETIRRALKPGGLLAMQEMEPEPDEAGRPSYTLRRLLSDAWGIPFAPTAEQLIAEAKSAGFDLIRVATTPVGRIILMRRPA